MDLLIGIVLALVMILGIAGAVALLLTKDHTKLPDYYALFIMGIIWLPIGLACDNPALWVMGFAFVALGLANKDKWKENRHDWKNLSKKEKNTRIIIISLLGTLVLAGFVLLLLIEKGIIQLG